MSRPELRASPARGLVDALPVGLALSALFSVVLVDCSPGSSACRDDVDCPEDTRCVLSEDPPACRSLDGDRQGELDAGVFADAGGGLAIVSASSSDIEARRTDAGSDMQPCATAISDHPSCCAEVVRCVDGVCELVGDPSLQLWNGCEEQ